MPPMLISEGYKYEKMGKVNDRMGLRAKILIVEDDESQRFLYSEEMREEGYEPITAKNAKEAIRMLQDFKPDLIILDIVMPVMDGMEALAQPPQPVEPC